MNIEFNKNDDYTAHVGVTIEPEDYTGALESELKKHQKSISRKGFRKGKTPKSMIRKMYGASILAEVVNNKLQESLNDYLVENKIKTIGQPMPAESQEQLHFEPGKKKSYHFSFEMGLEPEFDIQGLDESFHYYRTVIDEKTIDDQIDMMRRRGGKQVEVEDSFQDDDLITFNARELEGDDIKSDGFETTFDVLINRMTDDIREKVLESAVGEKIRFDIFDVEKNSDEEFVRKYFLKLEEDEMDREIHSMFEGEIVLAKRLELADLDEDFLKAAFGEDVTTEEAGRELIKNDLEGHYNAQADALLSQEVHKRIVEQTEIPLPDAFLKRWLMARAEDEADLEIVKANIEEEYNQGFRDSLRWQLIFGKLSEKYEVNVTEEEIIQELQRRIQQYMPGQQLSSEVLNSVLQSMASNREQVDKAQRDVATRKVMAFIKEELTLDQEDISQEDFQKKLDEINASEEEKYQDRIGEEGVSATEEEE